MKDSHLEPVRIFAMWICPRYKGQSHRIPFSFMVSRIRCDSIPAPNAYTRSLSYGTLPYMTYPTKTRSPITKTSVCVNPRCCVTTDIEDDTFLAVLLEFETVEFGWSMSGIREPTTARATVSAIGIISRTPKQRTRASPATMPAARCVLPVMLLPSHVCWCF